MSNKKKNLSGWIKSDCGCKGILIQETFHCMKACDSDDRSEIDFFVRPLNINGGGFEYLDRSESEALIKKLQTAIGKARRFEQIKSALSS